MAIVEISGVVKSFGQTRALAGVDLEVPEGTIQGLLGPNGAGKTTLVRILATLLKPDSGTALVDGHDVVRQAQKVRELIGLAGQFAAVDDQLTGRENLEVVGLLYGLRRREARTRATDALERLGLGDAADRLVRGYSGGMRRRLDLGASLVGEPRVLLLDEPTTGLDPRTRLELWEFLRGRVRDGATLLLTTQYLEEADHLADHIVVIDHGEVIARGTSDELKTRLGADVIEIVLADAAQLSPACDLIAPLSIDRPVIDEDARRLSVHAAGGATTMLAVVRALDDADVKVVDIGLRRPSLDDVFLALTGHAAEVAAE
jgi:ABC-2 type transport system ATP-binding protein